MVSFKCLVSAAVIVAAAATCCPNGCTVATGASAGTCNFGNAPGYTCPEGFKEVVDAMSGAKTCEVGNADGSCPAGYTLLDDGSATGTKSCQVGNEDGSCPAGYTLLDDGSATGTKSCQVGNEDGSCPAGYTLLDDGSATGTKSCQVGNADGSCPEGAVKIEDSMSSTSKCATVGTAEACEAKPAAGFCPAPPAPVAQTATEFCTDYTSKCASAPNMFGKIEDCETWFAAADAGTLGDPIDTTAAGATQACYQYHLSVAVDTGSQTTHCKHARGTELCVADGDSSSAGVTASLIGMIAAAFAALH